MKILKFGGSSVGNAERIKNVAKIIQDSLNENKNISVVFSAFQGVTDLLIKMSGFAAQGKLEYLDVFKEIETRHIKTIQELIQIKNQSGVIAAIKMSLNELEDVTNGVYLVKELSPRTLDFIMSFGERLSSFTINQALNDVNIKSEYLDSRALLKTDDNFGAAHVDFNLTNKNIKEYFKTHNKLQVITGFIGSTKNNETTTLGRGGSDYSAAIFGAALNVEEIEIWTDVDGVMTADPRKVKNAFPLASVTYEEAMELSHFGAKVIHPPTMHPALSRKIPLRIKNTFNPSFPGTVISAKSSVNHFQVKGISSIDEIALIRVQGSGMIGVAGIAKRIFAALSQKKINIILITQASSEHSLCLAVMPKFAQAAKEEIESELRFEIRDSKVNEVIVEDSFSIIAVVGERMRNTPGIAGKVFQALGKNGINIAAIAQGSSELNISTVVPRQHSAKALNALHDAFFLSGKKTLNLFLVGTGLIGKTLLKQIEYQAHTLADEYLLNFKMIGLANSRKMRFDPEGIALDKWQQIVDSSSEKTDLDKFVKQMKALNLPNCIFIDCTASEVVGKKYIEILESNISIVTPNKKANATKYEFFQKLKATAQKHNVKFLYETTVGAGLPIIGTLNDLVTSGDKLLKIEGILSGTLSFIFNVYKKGALFSQTLLEAKEKGYTEPDPREDLNGFDVARKLLVLARVAGLALEFKDIKIENLVPVKARKAKTVEEFFVKLKECDDYFEAKRKHAEENNKALRYIAKLENGKAEISLQEVDETHPFYSLTGSDNIFSFYTQRYRVNPIVIKGPGAGAEVTASGVFADIIRISNYLS
jgi:bifunctional aspartokinase / homoserine dehydrogenase 1